MTIGHYFNNQLAVSLNKTIEEVHPERMIMNGVAASLKETGNLSTSTSLLNFNTSIPSYKNEYEYTVLTSAGIAEFYTHAADDIPLVSMGRETIYGRLKEVALGDEYTHRDLQRSQAMGDDLIGKSMRAIHRGTDIKLEDVYYNGSTPHRLFGLLNFPGVTVNLLPNDGTAGSTTFASKTPAQMYRDIVSMALSVSARSKNAFYADTILLPLGVYNLLNTTVFTGATTTGDTVLEILRRNMAASPLGVKNIIPVPYLDGRGSLPNTGVGVVYSKKAENQEAILSDYLRKWDNSQGQGNDTVNYKYSFQMTSVTGGTVVYQPLSIIRYDVI
jgi:hypothetical protein